MSKATIVLPTRNRPQFLHRALRYLASVHCTLPILVTDSSDSEFRHEVQGVLDEVERSLNLAVIHFPPALDFPEKVVASLEWVNTEYCTLLADDDFIVPRSIESCTDFLAAHPDYTLAHGLAVSFRLSGANPCTGAITEVYAYPQMSQESPSGLERLRSHSCVYRTTFYSVHRLSIMKEIWAASVNTDMEFRELIPSFLAIAKGKSKCLEVFYMARQVHVASDSAQLTDPLLWLTTPRFSDGFLRLRKVLADALESELRGTDTERQATVHKIFYTYFAEYLAVRGGNRLVIQGYSGTERTYEPPPYDPRLDMASLVGGASPFFGEFNPIATSVRG